MCILLGYFGLDILDADWNDAVVICAAERQMPPRRSTEALGEGVYS
jgi:hypothetical protein